ncbi:lipoate--protein ligase [Isachenkonia alkalipeptolytica]|uniref:lipoate--protein ligase n=1 Tax=Isachenkonia alkalipeptolytica TaxID=2565777 RepID=A0AA43XLE0_9CLOT|nr:lipoate--protein ligase [Isachenkonia alkalipeptolytica]NBG88847.1 lipoate--protein ligase [Isachenkonia alkalipeptolytica]
MPEHTKIVRSKLYEGPVNLALEEYLLRNCDENTVILYLWQNNKTIVIGRHQNPYKECDVKKMEAEGVNLVRRKSGGGAVYQDLGNLNFTFISGRDHHDITRQYKVILKALESYGIYGEISGRNDLTVDGQKFSGNAFMNHKEVQCHHGTLLLDVDLKALPKYLTPSQLKIKARGVDSVKSRVVNLRSLNEKITTEDLSSKIIDAFKEEYSYTGEIEEIGPENVEEEVLGEAKAYEEWTWNYGKAPSFDLTLEEKYPWGVFEMDLSTKNGRIQEAAINTDCILKEDFIPLTKDLVGTPLAAKDMEEVLQNSLQNPEIIRDLQSLVREKL